jgi:uncharacterized protein (DUF4415 family)
LPKRIDPAARAAAIDAAPAAPVPDADNPPSRDGDWDKAIVSRSLPELREQLAARRPRGPGKRPAKTAIQLRLPPDALARWKATGPGWQTRMAEVLVRTVA